MRIKPLFTASLPCAALRRSPRLGRELPFRPAVSCSGSCCGCGWSRAEQARRLRLGRWQRDAHGCLSLRFPPIGAELSSGEEAP